jgi:hypothetical protein
MQFFFFSSAWKFSLYMGCAFLLMLFLSTLPTFHIAGVWHLF